MSTTTRPQTGVGKPTTHSKGLKAKRKASRRSVKEGRS